MMKYPKLLTDAAHLETQTVLKATAKAEAKLGELKGFVHTIPNESILLNTLPLQEAKASSEIENIVTTDDELFRSHVDDSVNGSAKEVRAHADALLHGFEIVKETRMLRLADILAIQCLLIRNDAGLRTQEGTVLKNGAGEVIYRPPPPRELPELMGNLINFINDDSLSPLNPLVKMAVIHHQFESIHPFYDGNGRTGRILNLLYLALAGKMDLPILYLSRYIIANKAEYYRLLQAVRDEQNWEQWLLYMLEGVAQTSEQTINLIRQITQLMGRYKIQIRSNHKFYSQDLVNNLFKHPYTRIDFLMADLRCSRPTASKYLDQLTNDNLLQKIRAGGQNYYVNHSLVDCLLNK